MSTQTLSTLTLTCFAAALWLGGNLALGNIAALDYLGVFVGVPWYWRRVVAATPSTLQLYLPNAKYADFAQAVRALASASVGASAVALPGERAPLPSQMWPLALSHRLKRRRPPPFWMQERGEICV